MEKSQLPDIREYNVIFNVMDSCRYDTAEKANTPFLNTISKLRKADSPATYTLPAHMSFFIGILPVLTDGNPEYLPGANQIWRSMEAHSSDKSVAVPFVGKNIMDFYVDNDYSVVGTGGVSFFSRGKNNILPKLFPRFLHFEKPRGLHKAANLPRTTDQFPLANIDRIASEIDRAKPYFLFVNCPETHVPYDSPVTTITEEYRAAVKKMYDIDKIKHCAVPEEQRLSDDERQILMNSQIQSLEWIDYKIKELRDSIDNGLPTLLVAMGDHGEEFGEGGRYGHAHYHANIMTVPLWCGITI